MNLPINQIICGDALQVLKEMPSGAVNCCISSPPYWALRDYGVDGQLGLEKTFEEYIDKLCTIYDEVKRVLRADGTCWVNLGDTYAGGGRGWEYWTGNEKQSTNPGSAIPKCPKVNIPDKSLCLIPDRFRIEMVNRGWIVRNKIIWHKPNPMPSSATDRFTVDFEPVIFMTKSNKPLCWIRPDGKMVAKKPDHKNGTEGLDWRWGTRRGKKVKLSLWQGEDYFFEPQYEPYQESSIDRYALAGQRNTEDFGTITDLNGWRSESYQNPSRIYKAGQGSVKSRGQNVDHLCVGGDNPLGRNKRTVWTIPTQSFAEAHFATFPEKLVEPMIKAGCPREVCSKCGQGRRKVYDKSGGTTGESWHDHNDDIGSGIRQTRGGVPLATAKSRAEKENPYKIDFKGYTDCGCKAEWRPGLVLDCFHGQWHGRQGCRAIRKELAWN